MIILFILGFSVPYAIGITSVIIIIMDKGLTGIPYEIVTQRFVQGTNNFTLLAIPFFLLAGKLMNTGESLQKYSTSPMSWLAGYRAVWESPTYLQASFSQA